MGLLKKEPVYPFSGFSGQLLHNGKPASYAMLIRSYEIVGDKSEETIKADEEGRFSFESIQVQYRAPALSSHEFLSRQQIFVDYKNERYQIWGGSKSEKGEYSEFGGKPKNLSCELTEEPRMVNKEALAFIGTNCHWEVE